jgi:hypothetical protein
MPHALNTRFFNGRVSVCSSLVSLTAASRIQGRVEVTSCSLLNRNNIIVKLERTMRLLSTIIVLAATASHSSAFIVGRSSKSRVAADTQLHFGIPGFLTPKNEDDKSSDASASTEKKEKEIGVSGILQLITAGMGAPFLGDFQGVDEDGKLMFSLEANNLVDEKGNSKQTQMPHFENGWVDPDDEGFKFPWQK